MTSINNKVKYFNNYLDSINYSDQIYLIFICILDCIQNKVNVLYLNGFLSNIDTKKIIPIDNILDIQKLNNLLQDYNLIIYDIINLNTEIKLIDVKYGLNDKYFDVTCKFIELLGNNSYLDKIDKINLNDFGDPVLFMQKDLLINLSINTDIITIREKELNGFISNSIIKSDIIFEGYKVYFLPTYVSTININVISVDYSMYDINSIKITEKFLDIFFRNNNLIIKQKFNLNNYVHPEYSDKYELKINLLINKNNIIINETERNKILNNNIVISNNYIDNFNNNSIIILEALYGSPEICINVTELIKDNFLINNKLIIKKNTDLNNYFGCPCTYPNKKLKLLLLVASKIIEIYEITNDGIIMNDIYITNNRYLEQVFTNSPNILLSNDNYKIMYNIINKFNFSKEINDLANNFINTNEINNKFINVIDLKLDIKTVNYWSTINGFGKDKFYDILEEKYIKLIKKYLNDNINDTTIILTENSNNKIIDFLKKYNYKIIVKENYNYKDYEELINLQIGAICNNIFIGCENLISSQFIHKRIKNTKSILLNLADIVDHEIIIIRNY